MKKGNEMNRNIFRNAEVDCADNYIMAMDNFTWKQAMRFLDENVIVEKLVFNPAVNQIRVSFRPVGYTGTDVFNIEKPPVSFLWSLWELKLDDIRQAIREYVCESDVKLEFLGKTLEKITKQQKDWLNGIILSIN